MFWASNYSRWEQNYHVKAACLVLFPANVAEVQLSTECRSWKRSDATSERQRRGGCSGGGSPRGGEGGRPGRSPAGRWTSSSRRQRVLGERERGKQKEVNSPRRGNLRRFHAGAPVPVPQPPHSFPKPEPGEGAGGLAPTSATAAPAPGAGGRGCGARGAAERRRSAGAGAAPKLSPSLRSESSAVWWRQGRRSQWALRVIFWEGGGVAPRGGRSLARLPCTVNGERAASAAAGGSAATFAPSASRSRLRRPPARGCGPAAAKAAERREGASAWGACSGVALNSQSSPPRVTCPAQVGRCGAEEAALEIAAASDGCFVCVYLRSPFLFHLRTHLAQALLNYLPSGTVRR